jgi:hypothetical protein
MADTDEPTLEWLTTELTEEALTSVEFAAQLLPRVGADRWLWKWIVIAMDNALQNIFVLAVAHTSGLNVLKLKRADVEAWETGKGEFPDGKLLPFPDLLEKVQGAEMIKYVHSRPLELSDDERGTIEWTHRMRNAFIHYQPMALSIDIDSFRESLRTCAEVADRIVAESGNVWWDAPGQADRFADAIAEIRRVMSPS